MTVLDNVMTGASCAIARRRAREKALEAIESSALRPGKKPRPRIHHTTQRRLERRARGDAAAHPVAGRSDAGLNPAEIDQAVALVRNGSRG